MSRWGQTRPAASRRGRRRATAALVLAAALASAAALGAAGEDPEALEVAPSVRRVLALDGDAASGERVYRTCAVCHLADGSGRPDGTFPQLAGQHRQVIVKQLVDIREGRRHNPVMKPYTEALVDDQDIADVAAYIESLPVPRPGASDGEETNPGGEGAALYRRDCLGCHGERGQGDPERFVPVLAGRHEGYLLAQIRAIAGGRRGNAHPGMERIVAGYTDAELRAVVHYAVHLPGPDRDR